MTDHRLHNPRPTPPRDAACGWCLQPLHKIHDLTEITTPRRGGPTFCNDLCWSEWVVNDKPAPMTAVPFIVNPSRPTRNANASKPAKSIAEINRNGAKSVARQTGEAAANIIGFVLWLIVACVIGTAILAII